jgi:hypothetical protein
MRIIRREPDPTLVRVSCGAFFRIQLGTARASASQEQPEFLVCLDTHRLHQPRPEEVYHPFGGAYQFFPDAKKMLQKMGAVFEYEYVSGIPRKNRRDLRLRIPLARLPDFEQWYRRGTPTTILQNEVYVVGRYQYPIHELEEELVEEVFWTDEDRSRGVISSINDIRMANEPYLRVVEPRWSTRARVEGEKTYTFTDLFDIHFSQPQEREAREAMAHTSALALVTPEDIIVRKQYQGHRIDDLCLLLCKGLNTRGHL